jgi:hypothetical protein
MPLNSRAKGATFELDVSKELSIWWGTKLRRTPLSGGWSKDNVTGDIAASEPYFPFSVECKSTESWEFFQLLKSPDKAELAEHWKQCVNDSQGRSFTSPGLLKKPLIPLLTFKRNFHPMYCGIRVQDWNLICSHATPSAMIWCYDGEDIIFMLLSHFLRAVDPKQFKPTV